MDFNRATVMRHFQLFQPYAYPQETGFRAIQSSAPPLRKAAVLVGFVERRAGLHVIFTKRSLHLRHHPGQISFPGGKCDRDDRSMYDTALREAREEIGLEAQYIEPLGYLPELKTISRFSITPVVAFISPQYRTLVDQNEVEEVFEVPASYLFHPQHLYHATFILRQTRQKIFGIPYRRHFIWGATAQIICALKQQLAPEN
jgi:8-oxo-dGTP pyrophosphatase MutT (NUDIX family)